MIFAGGVLAVSNYGTGHVIPGSSPRFKDRFGGVAAYLATCTGRLINEPPSVVELRFQGNDALAVGVVGAGVEFMTRVLTLFRHTHYHLRATLGAYWCFVG